MSRRPRKRFGQHFLRDRAVVEKILESFNPRPDQTIVEIGPGRGALTLPLLERVGAMHAVELDRDLADQLPARAAGHGDLILHRADALSFDFSTLARDNRLRLLGNLPYNISTPLLFRLVEQVDVIEDMTFMLQKEVADRLGARPGSKAYGRLSVMIQWRCQVEHVLDVGPEAFTPPPRVHSSVVRLRPWREPPIDVGDAQRFADVVKAAFGQRRKTLRNALRSFLDATAIATAGIDPTRRAEDLTLEEFACLSRAGTT